MPFDPRIKQVLLVDDEEGFASLLAQMLRMDGYEVEISVNGVDALEKMKEFVPDAIISDIVMPKMDGFEFFQAVKTNPITRKIPFLFITAFQDSELLNRARRIGIFGILRKPIDIDQIERRLKDLLR